MLIPFGILSAAGAGGGVAGDYELISSEILGTTAASVTFSSLGDYSSTYKHLQIRAVVRHSAADNENYTTITFNGSDFVETHYLVGLGSSVFAGREAKAYLYSTAGNCVSITLVSLWQTYSTHTALQRTKP
jgi:hypothetical protein